MWRLRPLDHLSELFYNIASYFEFANKKQEKIGNSDDFYLFYLNTAAENRRSFVFPTECRHDHTAVGVIGKIVKLMLIF